MTLTQRKKLAKAARELASDFAEGRGPRLEPQNWCGCVAACVIEQAGLSKYHPGFGLDKEWPAEELDALVGGSLTRASYVQEWGSHVMAPELAPIPGAVVFPLLWLADELERAP